MKQTTFEDLGVCPVCACKQITYLTDIPDHSISKEVFSVWRCPDCSLKFTNPRPDGATIGPYYESEDYISHSNTRKGLISQLYQSVRNITIRQKVALYNQLAGSLPKKVLDYGCGTGELLNALKIAGWEVTGVEPGEKAREYGVANYNIHVKTPDAFLAEPTETYSVISLWHVLEHVHDLNGTLTNIISSMEPNGTLIIAVPNADSWDAGHYSTAWAAYDVPRHLYHFNKKSIATLFDPLGMKISAILPMKFDSYYVSLLSEKYSTGKTNYFSALINGFKSNNAGKKDILKYSSLIYVLKKQE